ncbi:hypothetical protein HGRIS_004653 [Hohenbuehelia grisea]|uniref:Uncharacterized protein n=1 Tax=Hohenbuehelia grisea TaxID=104357 RepID=A0ABR3JCI3_9AGAR
MDLRWCSVCGHHSNISDTQLYCSLTCLSLDRVNASSHNHAQIIPITDSSKMQDIRVWLNSVAEHEYDGPPSHPAHFAPIQPSRHPDPLPALIGNAQRAYITMQECAPQVTPTRSPVPPSKDILKRFSRSRAASASVPSPPAYTPFVAPPSPTTSTTVTPKGTPDAPVPAPASPPASPATTFNKFFSRRPIQGCIPASAPPILTPSTQALASPTPMSPVSGHSDVPSVPSATNLSTAASSTLPSTSVGSERPGVAIPRRRAQAHEFRHYRDSQEGGSSR